MCKFGWKSSDCIEYEGSIAQTFTYIKKSLIYQMSAPDEEQPNKETYI